MKYTNEELLAIAIEKYPINTVCRAIYGSRKLYTIIGDPFLFNINDGLQRISVLAKEKVDTPYNTFAIYSNEKGWAIILSSSLNYQIY